MMSNSRFRDAIVAYLSEHVIYLVPNKGNVFIRRDVPVGVPLDLSTPTGMSCIGTYGENCKSDNVSKIMFYKLLFYYYGMKN